MYQMFLNLSAAEEQTLMYIAGGLLLKHVPSLQFFVHGIYPMYHDAKEYWLLSYLVVISKIVWAKYLNMEYDAIRNMKLDVM